SSRAKAPTRPSRTSSWSSTMTTRTWVVPVVSVVFMVPPNSCEQSVGFLDGRRGRHAVQPHGYHGAVGVVVGHLQLARDEAGALAHDLEPVGVVAARPEAAAVVGDDHLGDRWGDRALHVD